MVMEKDWGFVRAAAGKVFIKSPVSMNVAGVAGYTAYFYRGRTFDACQNLMNKNARNQAD